MRKVIVLAVLLTVICTPAFAQFQYYKGTGNDSWGNNLTSLNSAGAWTLQMPNGGSGSVNGCMYADFTGSYKSVSFTLSTTNCPDCASNNNEGDGSFWCEVYVIKLSSTGGAAEAAACMAGTAGSWTDKLTSNHQWNDYWGTGISGTWQSLYQWKNDSTHYAKPGGGTLGAAGMHYLGKTGQSPNDANGNGGWRINDSYNFNVSFGAGFSGDVFIGIKTGIYNAGTDCTKGGANATASTYGQSISNLTFVPTVPEPGSLLALGSGLFGLFGFAIRRRK